MSKLLNYWTYHPGLAPNYLPCLDLLKEYNERPNESLEEITLKLVPPSIQAKGWHTTILPLSFQNFYNIFTEGRIYLPTLNSQSLNYDRVYNKKTWYDHLIMRVPVLADYKDHLYLLKAYEVVTTGSEGCEYIDNGEIYVGQTLKDIMMYGFTDAERVKWFGITNIDIDEDADYEF